MFSVSGFPYELGWLSLYTPGSMVFIGVALVILCLAGAIFLGPYLYGYSLVRIEEGSIAQKKSILGDLVLMKDIQSELDKEIEDMMLTSLMNKES